MMRKRLFLAAGAIAGLVGVVLVVVAMLPPDDRPGITKDNFDRLERRMTRAQVDAILGQHADEHTGMGGDRIEGFFWPTWTSDSGDQVFIEFDDNRLVESMTWRYGDNRTLYERIRDWLPWWRPEAA